MCRLREGDDKPGREQHFGVPDVSGTRVTDRDPVHALQSHWIADRAGRLV